MTPCLDHRHCYYCDYCDYYYYDYCRLIPFLTPFPPIPPPLVAGVVVNPNALRPSPSHHSLHHHRSDWIHWAPPYLLRESGARVRWCDSNGWVVRWYLFLSVVAVVTETLSVDWMVGKVIRVNSQIVLVALLDHRRVLSQSR